MAENARDEGVALPGQALLPFLVKECVFAVLVQGHIGVHSVSGQAVDGLGHEGGVEVVPLGDGFHRQLEGHNLVGTLQGGGVFEVDLVLAGGHLMVGRLDLIAHLLQGQTDPPPGGLAVIQGAQVEVARLVVGFGGGLAVLVGLEQEKFRLRAYVEGVVAHGLRPLQHALQHAPGITHKGGAVRVVHVADQPRHLGVLGLPGEDHEAVQIGIEVLVGLVDADKSLDGGAVQHDLVVHRPLHLGGGDGHVFQLTENVGELHPDELDVLLPHDADDVLFRIAHVGFPFPERPRRGKRPGPDCRFLSQIWVQYIIKAVFVNQFLLRRKISAQKSGSNASQTKFL